MSFEAPVLACLKACTGSIDGKIFNYSVAQLFAFSIEISDIENSRPQDGAAASIRLATTLKLSLTNHRSFNINY